MGMGGGNTTVYAERLGTEIWCSLQLGRHDFLTSLSRKSCPANLERQLLMYILGVTNRVEAVSARTLQIPAAALFSNVTDSVLPTPSLIAFLVARRNSHACPPQN